MSLDVGKETIRAFEKEREILEDRKRKIMENMAVIGAEMDSLIMSHEMMLRVLMSIKGHMEDAQKEETAKQLIEKVREERKEHDAP